MKSLWLHLVLLAAGSSILCPDGCQNIPPPSEATFADIDFVWIVPGTFTMGSPKSPEELVDIYGDRIYYFESEVPQHEVTLTGGFWMGKFEVTQGQWKAVMGVDPPYYRGDDYPVEGVTWFQCIEFIDELNTMGEGTFRLPTEAEWEYACRAGTTTDFYFGDNPDDLDTYCWYYANSPDYQPEAVGTKPPNPWGLYDMHGNVWEWCQDWYGREYYAESPQTDPMGPEEGDFKVRRGGSSSARSKSFCRSPFRYWNRPDGVATTVGMRVVRNPDL